MRLGYYKVFLALTLTSSTSFAKVGPWTSFYDAMPEWVWTGHGTHVCPDEVSYTVDLQERVMVANLPDGRNYVDGVNVHYDPDQNRIYVMGSKTLVLGPNKTVTAEGVEGFCQSVSGE